MLKILPSPEDKGFLLRVYEIYEYGELKNPTLESPLYTEPFEAYFSPTGEKEPRVKARAFKDNYEPSDIAVFEG